MHLLLDEQTVKEKTKMLDLIISVLLILFVFVAPVLMSLLINRTVK